MRDEELDAMITMFKPLQDENLRLKKALKDQGMKLRAIKLLNLLAFRSNKPWYIPHCNVLSIINKKKEQRS